MVRNSIGESWSIFLNMRQHVARLTEALPAISFNEISSSKWEDVQMIEDYHNLKEEQQKRLMAYMEALKKIESLEDM